MLLGRAFLLEHICARAPEGLTMAYKMLKCATILTYVQNKVFDAAKSPSYYILLLQRYTATRV
jgi:hypothetical protein